MNKEDIAKVKAEIIQELIKEYFLFPRNALWAFVGGLVAFLITTGVVSYKSALVRLTNPAVVAAQKAVLDAEGQSTKALATIQSNLQKSGNVESRLSTVSDKIAEVEDQLATKASLNTFYRLRSNIGGAYSDAGINGDVLLGKNKNDTPIIATTTSKNVNPGTGWKLVTQ